MECPAQSKALLALGSASYSFRHIIPTSPLLLHFDAEPCCHWILRVGATAHAVQLPQRLPSPSCEVAAWPDAFKT
jgi:hypothetical protein